MAFKAFICFVRVYYPNGHETGYFGETFISQSFASANKIKQCKKTNDKLNNCITQQTEPHKSKQTENRQNRARRKKCLTTYTL